jgi:hypothetical protein
MAAPRAWLAGAALAAAVACASSKMNRLPPAAAVPAEPPDSVPAWAVADSSYIGPSQYISAKFIKNLVVLQFREGATQAQRQSAIELVSGTVIGGYRSSGIYLVRVADPGDGSGIVQAAERLSALPFVSAASPDIAIGLQ